ncbi:hypothetical protein Acsp03_12880 [Actinomadura sp. NBRC 104412]|uniref:DUF6328 family protein n=1 Tax=Actinomadura sp. NBRC 104412 TaxID=3032203 RepID=UPI0024A3A6B7|nr:DUF6328 family protein [Actinomadura sp. NBRC 104412]GLZ03822.1 hypothetical protein Acsp03_12880 [Actinomadura sp. NBRC 104412]
MTKLHRSPIDESPAERSVRNFIELLQGLRVAATGVQVLFAFLLTVPFAHGYDRLPAKDRWLFYLALVGAAVASVLFIAPVAQHRILFRQGRKEALVRQSNLYGIVGSLALAVSMTTGIMVVVDFMFTGRLAMVTAIGLALLAGWLWFCKPLVIRIRGRRTAYPDEVERVAAPPQALGTPTEESSRHY